MTKTLSRLVASAALSAVALAAAPAFAGKTLDTIKQRGQLVCGVNTGLAGFSAADSQGNWTGLDVDSCKALAASVLGDASKAREKLGWEARTTFDALVREMVDCDLAAARKYALIRQNGFQAFAHHE